MGRPIGLECHRGGVPNALIDYAEDCAVRLTIPAATPAGAYVVLACADDAGRVAERSETNNCTASAGPITATSP